MSEPPAVLRIGSDETELPMIVGTEGERGIDISKLRAQTGAVTLDNGFVNTASCESAITFIDGEAGILRYRGIPIEELVSVPVPSFLETSYLLIYGELPTRTAARRVPLRDPQAHAPARGRQALLRRLPEGRPPDGHAVVGGERAVDLLPGQQRPPRPRPGAPLDPAAHGEAADDRGVRVQEVDRPAVPLPRQLARPRRELPHDDVRGAVGALRGEPQHRGHAQAAPDPARRPRAELLHQHGAPGRFERGQPLRVDRRRHQRAVGPAARRRQPGGHRDARPHRGRRRRRRQVRPHGQGPRRPVPPLGLRSPRLQELRPARPHPQGRLPPGDRRPRHDGHSSSTSRCGSRRSR